MKKYRTIWMALLQWGLLLTLIVGCSLVWNQRLVRQNINEFARHEATTVIQKTLVFRSWATMHGGVYVRPTEQTPPNPWLTVPKRDVVTTDGDKLTLMNPAYMTRQVMGLYKEQSGFKGHITSLQLKNPGNAPDAWETVALQRFEKGETSVHELITISGIPHYRLILPMKMEQGCLKCHADTAIPVDGIRGGISAAVPLTPYLQSAGMAIRGIRLAHGGIWLMGMLGITCASVLYHRQQQRQRQAEDNLRTQEALYASLTTAASIGIFHADRQGKCQYVNQCWSELTGMPLEQALGDGWETALHPDDRQRFFETWQEAVATRHSFTMEYRYRHPGGRIVWVYSQSAEIFDNNGMITGYVRTVTDITQRKKTEAALAETTLFLKESQTIARLGGWKSHPVSGMLDWTDEMYRLLEHPQDEALSHEGSSHYFDPQDRPQVMEALRDALDDGIPFRMNVRMINRSGHRSGHRFWVDFRCIGRLEGPEGSYIAGTMQDITEHKQIEELLTSAREMAEATSRTKTELLGTLSHELRTPLNGVMGGVQLLEMTELSGEQEEYLQMLRVSAANELALVNDLLDLADLEASGTKIESAPFNLLDSICLALTLNRSALEVRGLPLITSLPDSLSKQVLGDGRHLSRIVTNLLGNAIKFTEQGSISIAAETAPCGGGEVRLHLRISDTGIGINPQDLERIFEPFVQADMSSTRRFGGTGLGLAICRKLAERMGGSIRVDSLPGEGSIFTLELPLQCVDAEPGTSLDAGTAAQLPVWNGPCLTVLIAEDNETNLKAAAGLVTKLGLKAVCVEDGKRALAHWMTGRVDAILMDIQMPVMDGREAVHFIRQREQGGDKRTPIIALTAHAMAGDRELLLSEGFDGYVAKPFLLPELAAELERVTKTVTLDS